MSTPDAGTADGGPDVGAPNDGNGGHGSATTPPDCLFIPTDITGYCGDVKYKVIYDCPNGAPYDDCDAQYDELERHLLLRTLTGVSLVTTERSHGVFEQAVLAAPQHMRRLLASTPAAPSAALAS